jgi:hypothetical protein
MADRFTRTAGQATKVDAAAPEGRRQPRRAATPAPRWGPLVSVLAAVVVAALLVLAFGGYVFNWTWTGFGGNTVWDWLSLLITPVTLGWRRSR